MFKSRKPGRNESWESVVTKKSRAIVDGSGAYFYVTVDPTTGGGARKIRIDRKLWKSLEVGDVIEKAVGAAPVKKAG
jgi:hypothetical protein